MAEPQAVDHARLAEMQAPPEARTIAEAYVHLELTLPPSDEWVDYDRYTTLTTGGDRYLLRFAGPVAGRRHVAEVVIPIESDRASDGDFLSYGPGRSRLVDAGQWHLMELANVGLAQAGLQRLAGRAPDDDTYRAVYGAWDAARACVDEVAKFLPPDADEVPDEAFWTEQGRRVRAEQPAAFHRIRLTAARAAYRRQLEDFVARYDMLMQPAEPEEQARDPLPVRTYGEAHVYMDTHPCRCGCAQFPRGLMEVLTDDEHGVVLRYAGPCDDCQRPRDFRFRMPQRRGLPPDNPYRFSYSQDGPSQVLDAGDWLGVAHAYGEVVDGLLQPDQAQAGWSELMDYEDALKLLTGAAAALDEVVKFLPAGAERVPTAALWTVTGHEHHRLHPEQFERRWIEEQRAARWRQVTEFHARYGR